MATQMMAGTVVMNIEHIVKTPGVCDGRARIAGRRIPVSSIVEAYLEHETSVEELVSSFDLTRAQVHAAFAYYYDHQKEINGDIEAEKQARARLFERFGNEAEQEKLRARWREKHPNPAGDAEREMTASEVAETYGVTPQAVRIAAKSGWLPARKSGAIWLIRRRDAEARWGKRRASHP